MNKEINKYLILLLFLSLIIVRCSSFSSLIMTEKSSCDGLKELIVLCELLENKEETQYSTDINKRIHRLDLLCSENVSIDTSYSYDEIIDKLDHTLEADLLVKDFTKTSKPICEIIYNEFKFRSIVAAQFRLETIYHNMPSEKRLKNMINYTTVNIDYGNIKTDLLRNSISTLSKILIKEDRERGWLAIHRMLNEIDLRKSEGGNQHVRRSPYGIYVNHGEIIGSLSQLTKDELDKEIKSFAEEVINNVQAADTKYEEYKSENIRVSYPERTSKHLENAIRASEIFNNAEVEADHFIKVSLYSEAVILNPVFTDAYINRGVSYYNLDSLKMALLDFEKALQIDPENVVAHSYKGICNYKLKDYKSAIEDYTRAINLDQYTIISYINRGLCWQKLRMYDKAVNDYSKAIEFDPQRTTSFINRGICYNYLSKFSKAIADFEKVIQLAPNEDTGYYNLGNVYWQLKKWDKVIEVWEKGLAVNPANNTIRSKLVTAKRYKRNKK